jgi:phospholipase C
MFISTMEKRTGQFEVWKPARPWSLPVISIMAFLFFLITTLCFCGTNPVISGSLADIEHVVLFMQENRAFDHVSLPFLSQI